jgi:hypothetical protein
VECVDFEGFEDFVDFEGIKPFWGVKYSYHAAFVFMVFVILLIVIA